MNFGGNAIEMRHFGSLVSMPATALIFATALASALMPSTAARAETPSVFLKGPYLQNVTKKSVTVMWETRVESIGSVTVLTDPPRVVKSPPNQIHEVSVTGLEPGRRYRYKVTSGEFNASGEFATAPGPSAPFSFIVFGDSRSNASSHRRVVERIRREVPDFLLGTGDMVNEGASDFDWQQFFDIEREILSENVLYPSLGNHDRQGRGRTADNYRQLFSLPENSPNPERYYAFTYGNSRFLILDSNSYSFALTDQTAWIEQQLQAARLDRSIEHIFVSMHHPPFSISLHGGQSELREAWTPLFAKYQVAAVFSGHDHVYSRAQRDGVRYFVSGGGGAPLYPRRANSKAIDIEVTKFFERTNHYLRVHVIGKSIETTAVRADGSLVETVRWGKQRTEQERNERLVALAGRVGSGTKAGDFGDGDGDFLAASGPAASLAPSTGEVNPTDGAERGRFGALGFLGIALALGAGFVLIRAVRTS